MGRAAQETAGRHQLPGPRHARRTCARGHRPRVRLRRARPHASRLAGPPSPMPASTGCADHAERGRDWHFPDPRLPQEPPSYDDAFVRDAFSAHQRACDKGPRCRPPGRTPTHARQCCSARGFDVETAAPSPGGGVRRPAQAASHARSSTAWRDAATAAMPARRRTSPPGTRAAVRSAPHGARRCLSRAPRPLRQPPVATRRLPARPPRRPRADERRSPGALDARLPVLRALASLGCSPACCGGSNRAPSSPSSSAPRRRLALALRDRRAADGLVGVALAAGLQAPAQLRHALREYYLASFLNQICRAG